MPQPCTCPILTGIVHTTIAFGKKSFLHRAIRQRWLLLLVLPCAAYMIVFNYLPMYGLVMAFQEFDPFSGFLKSTWVGLANFVELFNDPSFWTSVVNTLKISILKLVIGFPFPILFALLINEIPGRKFKKTVQTISYLPYFISWVFVVSFMYTLFSPKTGVVNLALKAIGIGDGNIFFMGEPRYFLWLAVFTDVWKNFGWNSVVYLAAIAGIDPQLYEAATIDGAGRIRRMIHITLPCIKSTIIVLLVLSLSYIITQNFDQMYLMMNALTQDSAEIINTYAYRMGIVLGRYSYGTAVGLFQSIVSVILLVSSNLASRRVTGEGLY
jgi:putative aldouronate transport system permease protein